ncbi:MAG: ATP-binding protein [Acidobacteriota bacterium]|jgi:hypothetical protein|nr:ATP-binding protein [Acidobacteriota bacterium]
MNTKNILSDNTEVIDITPDISLMPKLGFAGYSAPQAIGELVDNAIDARLDDVPLVVNIDIKKDKIVVADNGSGMDKNVASKSLVLAFSQKKGKLGEFGLGLKTACLSLGDYFKVITSTLGERYTYQISFDKNEWEESTKGWKIPLEKELTEIDSHFTVVEIRRLKVFYPNLHNLVRNDLQKRYSPFIRTHQLKIKVNGKNCKPESINLIEDSLKNFSIKLKNDNKIFGWYGLLKEGSQKGLYGFHIFRRGRMISIYDKFGFDPHPTLARIIGEISMDHVPVTHNKREFIKNSPEYMECESVMREELSELVKLARRKATQDTVTKEIKNDIEIWKDKICESLYSDELKNYTSQLKNIEPVSDPKGEELDDVEVEKRKEAKESIRAKDTAKDQVERNPVEKHARRRHVIRIKGKNIDFNHTFAPLGVMQSWKTYTFDKDKGIDIYTNTDFPSYLATKDKVFYAVIHIAEAIAEVLIQAAQVDASNIDELKELILRKSSELKSQI